MRKFKFTFSIEQLVGSLQSKTKRYNKIRPVEGSGKPHLA